MFPLGSEDIFHQFLKSPPEDMCTDFREEGGEREDHGSVTSCTRPDRPGIQPAALWCAGSHATQMSSPARVPLRFQNTLGNYTQKVGRCLSGSSVRVTGVEGHTRRLGFSRIWELWRTDSK